MKYKTIEQFKKIIGDRPVFSVEGAIAPLFLAMSWQRNEHPLNLLFIAKDEKTYLALDEKEYIAIATDKFREYFEGRISIKTLEEEYYAWEDKVFAYYEKFNATDLEKISDSKLGQYVNEINKIFDEIVKTIYIENVDYEKILSVIGVKHKNNLDLSWEKGTQAIFLSFEQRRLKKMLELITNCKGDLIRNVKFMFTDYRWTQDELSISKALNEIKEKYDEKIAEVNKSVKELTKIKREYDKWLRILPDAARKIAIFAQLVMHMRDLRKDPLAQINAMLAEISIVILKRAKVNVKFAPNVLIYEYIKGVEYIASNKKNIETRNKGCIYIVHPDFSFVTENCNFEEAVSQAKKTLENKNYQVTHLKGQTAYSGKVTGIARIVLDPRDNKNFQKGDILITSMTRPEFLQIMKMSSAVVTNEGGITCHAAIISRELRIPCVTGTKIATKIFHNGDLVEVDANKGIVRIIEKNKK